MDENIKKALIDWNPWLNSVFPEKLYGFEREYDLTEYLKVREIKILEGSRRSGKSTLIYQVIKKVLEKDNQVLYINFDDETLKNYSLSDIYHAYLEIGKVRYLFLDEVQNCKEWVHFVRKLYDLKEVEQIWITGSNSSLIKKEYAKLFTGRNITLKIHTLSFSEYLVFKGFNLKKLIGSKETIELKKYFAEYTHFGAFPEIALKEVKQKEVLQNYYDDFIYKDIISRYDINSTKLKELSLFLVSNASKPLSYRSLAKALNLNFATIQDYFSYLTDVFLFYEIYKFDVSLKKQFVNDKKVYVLDSGIANAVSFKFSEDKGRILENLVYIELLRRSSDLYFFKETKECDFLIKEGNEIISAIQVAYSIDDIKTKEREINGLIAALKTFKLKDGLIITSESEEELKIDSYTINIVPAWKWFLKRK